MLSGSLPTYVLRAEQALRAGRLVTIDYALRDAVVTVAELDRAGELTHPYLLRIYQAPDGGELELSARINAAEALALRPAGARYHGAPDGGRPATVHAFWSAVTAATR